MNPKENVWERFVELPCETLDLIIFGGLPENGLFPEEVTVPERLHRYFCDAPEVIKSILERAVYEWLDALSLKRPPQPRDYLATKITELLEAACDLDMKYLAQLMGSNAEAWASCFVPLIHAPGPDPLSAFCRVLATGYPDHKFLFPFWIDIATFKIHRSLPSAEQASRILIGYLAKNTEDNFFANLCVREAIALGTHFGSSEARKSWQERWRAALFGWDRTAVTTLLEVMHECIPADAVIADAWIRELKFRITPPTTKPVPQAESARRSSPPRSQSGSQANRPTLNLFPEPA